MRLLKKIIHDKNMLIIQLSKEGQKTCEAYEKDDGGSDLIYLLENEQVDEDLIDKIQELIEQQHELEHILKRSEKLEHIEQCFKTIGENLK